MGYVKRKNASIGTYYRIIEKSFKHTVYIKLNALL